MWCSLPACYELLHGILWRLLYICSYVRCQFLTFRLWDFHGGQHRARHPEASLYLLGGNQKHVPIVVQFQYDTAHGLPKGGLIPCKVKSMEPQGTPRAQ
jgi:hypothetical protein